MSSLQTATDIYVMVFMSIILLAMLIGGIVLLRMMRKVKKAKQQIQRKLNVMRGTPYIIKEVVRALLRYSRNR